MLSAVFHHVFPASLYGGRTAFAALSRIDHELRSCRQASAVAGILERSQPDLYARLLERFGPYVIGVYFCNYGEPLLNLRTPKLIRLAKEYLLGTALSTSLSVRRFDAEAWVESGLDFMVLSIDGVTQPDERFRRSGNLELVFSNIRKLVDTRRRLGRRTPVLSRRRVGRNHAPVEFAPGPLRRPSEHEPLRRGEASGPGTPLKCGAPGPRGAR